MKRLFSALIIMIICLSAAQGDPLTDGGIHSFSEFTPDDESYVYYTVGGKTYGAEILPIPTPGGFSSSVSGIVTVPNDADSEKFISLWLNKNHTVSGYTLGAVMAAAESGDIMAVGNETNITLRTFVWKAGASEGVPAEDYVIDIIKGNDRTRHWFDNTYTAEGNEALELRIYSNPFAEEYTPSGYSHGSFNIYSDKALPFESEWNIKPARQYSLREAKSLRDGAPVSLSEDIIATSSPANGTFFAQNRDRTQGVRMAGITAEFGDVLKNVTAVKSTLPTGETLLTVQNRTAGGSEAPLPMAMKIAALSQGIDLNDVYVRLWGKVMSKTDTSAAITDGSGTVTVDLSGASTSLRVGDFVTVTGHTYGNIIIPRRTSDILVFGDATRSLRTAAPGPEVTDWSYIFTPNELIAPRGAESCLRALITAKQYVWAYINDRDWSMNGTQPEGDLVYPNQQIPYNGTAVQLYTANLYNHNVFYVYATQPFAASFFAGDATLAYTGDNHLWEYSPNFAGGGADPTDPAYTWVPATY
ncbi:MAG: hypothetical protein J6X38_02710, partial [Abditibacteriota bacterium]|nr:hypothetical protein [Abditibacteriota bacterium]